MAELAQEDPLTGLLNRRGFEQKLERELADHRRFGVRAALLFINVDDLEQANDVFGHATGDTLLLRVVEGLRDGTRETDVLGRLGGDEFACLLRHCRTETAQQALGVAARILDHLSAKPVLIGAETLPVSASIGIALLPEHGASVDALQTSAMYQAKGAGGGQARAWSPDEPMPASWRGGLSP